MKKISILFFISLLLTSCSLEDEGVNFVYEFSVVSQTDLPASFEKGKTYTVKVKYLLPTACHTPAGIEAKRGNTIGEQRRDIYIAGIARKDANLNVCTTEEGNLEKESSFSILIDEDEPYTFYLWNGLNDENESQYTVIEVPVVE